MRWSPARRIVAVVMGCLIVAPGCGAARVNMFSSDPKGATIYELQGRYLVRRVGKAPTEERVPSLVDLLTLGPLAFSVSHPWYERVGYAIVFLPVMVPLVGCTRLANFLLPPWGLTTYGAVHQGRFLLRPSSRLVVCSGQRNEAKLHFDFARPSPITRPPNLQPWLAGKTRDEVRNELGLPLSIQADRSGAEEFWRYQDFDVKFVKVPPKRKRLTHVELQLARKTPDEIRRELGAPFSIEREKNLGEVWRYQHFCLEFRGSSIYRVWEISQTKAPAFRFQKILERNKTIL